MRFKRFSDLSIQDTKIDTHIHTNQIDGHSTIEDIIEYSKKIDMKTIAITEHVAITTDWYTNFKQHIDDIRRDNNGLELLIGSESRALDFNGTLNITDEIIDESELIVGSVHSYPNHNSIIPIRKIPYLSPDRAIKIEFNALMGLLDNELVDVIGHPFGVCRTIFEIEDKYFRKFIEKAVDTKKVIEINSKYHLGYKFANILRDLNPYVTMGSDSHHVSEIGRSFDLYAMLYM